MRRQKDFLFINLLLNELILELNSIMFKIIINCIDVTN